MPAEAAAYLATPQRPRTAQHPARQGHPQRQRGRHRRLADPHRPPPAQTAGRPRQRAGIPLNTLTKPLAYPDITDEAELAAAPGWTLHDLRHSALTHAAENGANTGTLLAHSGHPSVASLARYTRVSPDALTRWQARRDPHHRR